MAITITRAELHALAWDRPMTKLAAEFSLSDVALHKICRKHGVPTPPVGYWAKKAHGKPVKVTPLPRPDEPGSITIREGKASEEGVAIAETRAAVRAKLVDWDPTQRAPTGCCQSNRNSSPIDGAVARGALVQAIIVCHSARAAERRCCRSLGRRGGVRD